MVVQRNPDTKRRQGHRGFWPGHVQRCKRCRQTCQGAFSSGIQGKTI
jgi:hypothetical protein